MNKYVTQVGNAEKHQMEKQQITKSSQIENKEKEKEKKKLQNRTTYESDTLSESRIEQETDIEPDPRGEQLQQDNLSFPTKSEIASMFDALEKSLKIEMERIHRNLGHILE